MAPVNTHNHIEVQGAKAEATMRTAMGKGLQLLLAFAGRGTS